MTTAVGFLCFSIAVVALGIALYACWRLEQLEDDIYRLGWNLESFAGAVRRSRSDEATEHPDN